MRRSRRKMVALLLVVAFMLSGPIAPLWAAEVETTASNPASKYQYIRNLGATLNINSSGIASCSGYMNTWGSYKVEMTMELQKYNSSQRRWDRVYTWPTVKGDGAKGVKKEGSYMVGSGRYRVALTGKVLSSNSSVLESKTVYSNEVTR